MLTKLSGASVYDPVQGWAGEIRDLYFRDGRVAADPGPDAAIDEVHDLSGHILMAGAIDIHSHIAGGNVNTARVLLPEQHRNSMARWLNPPGLTPSMGFAPSGPALRSPLAPAGLGRTAEWSSADIGHRYARMGYTTVVEPAVLPANALDAHLQMADIPIVDTAGLAILGSDDFLLGLLRGKAGQAQVNDYVAWTLRATRCLGLKVINAGGAAAFKWNVRQFDLDDVVPYYGVSSRQILQTLQRAVCELGIPHPVHVHCNNLGVPGNVETAVATMEAAQGLPMHLAHVQFYGYGKEGAKGFSSGAARLMEAFHRHPNITMDVGQVLFGQTVTVSGDVIAQYDRHGDASPGKWAVWEAECDGAGGVVPYRYRERSFVNTLQWAVGLEIFLLAEDPWRLFFTTDHPNGAPFTAYPELIRLLMDADYRASVMARLDQEALALTLLPHLRREFSLHDIAVMTRAAAARLLGLEDRGHLCPGAIADVAVYRPQADRRAMFADAAWVWKGGRLVVREGAVVDRPAGSALTIEPCYDRRIERDVKAYFDRFYSLSLDHFTVGSVAFEREDAERFRSIRAA
ncbi:formylmethanofuran dehydrogenase subunit A [Methylococcus capsulatus]|uniref:formylmethanofuran dehydrogenase subunit A n=1 Tax=Methylococcus capsulatus TaxID=414 RepID=UPI001C52BCD6|nr:formylmethanofuran dehydrogenase subunit A [Methylococcus capsulatus]QXP87099.1 formylmethanofuran dehydrogenase subunit A [Methylococcus capsulatus]QXP91553.1 formylmethanofuran dehydrogenase subunit A [Methylococcus capsulatus]QXP93221.1 formylmethanofuran dehydrogenase subunit A [Methylococcus capsulatus]UQN12085.1 formylmethanofuran dehydrogenase subunit A [Methylococcus capsulatus]